jgi:hypothetical protein
LRRSDPLPAAAPARLEALFLAWLRIILRAILLALLHGFASRPAVKSAFQRSTHYVSETNAFLTISRTSPYLRAGSAL